MDKDNKKIPQKKLIVSDSMIGMVNGLDVSPTVKSIVALNNNPLSILVSLNNTGMADDEELLELVEMDEKTDSTIPRPEARISSKILNKKRNDLNNE